MDYDEYEEMELQGIMDESEKNDVDWCEGCNHEDCACCPHNPAFEDRY